MTEKELNQKAAKITMKILELETELNKINKEIKESKDKLKELQKK